MGYPGNSLTKQGRGNCGREDGRDRFVSVIVPVRDNRDGIAQLLACLGAQTLPRDRFEVVIGDDGSQTGSLLDFETSDGSVRVLPGPPLTSYAARNRAARSATGRVLAFCDSDCLPEPTWLEEGLAALKAVDLVAGEVVFIAPERPTVWSLLTVDMFLDQGRNVRLSRAVTANLFVARKTFDGCGGFDESLPSGGDYDFVARSVARGARLAYAPRAIVRHPTLDDRSSFLRKVWRTNWWSAARRARDGERMHWPGVLTFVPFLGTALARKQALRPILRLCRARLEVSGLRPSWRDDARALVVLYFFVAFVEDLGRIRGRREGCQLENV
jgi:glycosyltransferase involved in cell wall biosynthesis